MWSLTKGQNAQFDVKIEDDCKSGNHRNIIHLYEGDSKYIADEIAKVVQRIYESEGDVGVLKWYNSYFEQFLKYKEKEEAFSKMEK